MCEKHFREIGGLRKEWPGELFSELSAGEDSIRSHTMDCDAIWMSKICMWVDYSRLGACQNSIHAVLLK